MTCKEKLAMEYPEWDERDLELHRIGDCPQEHMNITEAEFCKGSYDPDACEKCWDREIPEDIPTYPLTPDEQKTLEKIRNCQPIIKDSGDRTEFATGAVRDMREGKGRCDLMPLEVVAEWLKDDVLGCIAQFKTHGTAVFLYGALNYFLDKAGWSYYEACLEVAKHFEEGAKKYGENNWQKGIPVHCYIDSAIRHYFKFMCGMKDEPHDRAFVWNLMCSIWEVDYSPRAEEKQNAD